MGVCLFMAHCTVEFLTFSKTKLYSQTVLKNEIQLLKEEWRLVL